MIGVIVSASPVPLPSRPRTEAALDYLRDVKQALARVSTGAATPTLVAKLIVHTSER